MSTATGRRIVALSFLLAPIASAADWLDPLPTFNQSPLVQVYGLPAPDGARVLARGQWRVQARFEAANNFLSLENSDESLVLDGETHRTAVTVRFGGGANEWGIEIPYISHSGGSLDGFIVNWHDTFGLPQGGRDTAPFDQLRFVYTRAGVERLRITDASSGIGDVRLLAGWRRPHRAETDVALRASLKLPTGDAKQLHGSGGVDAALWLSGACATGSCWETVGWNAHAGVVLLGRGDVLPEMQRRAVAFGGAGLAYRPWHPTVFKAELRAHTPFYRDSDLAALGVTGFQLILGGTWIVDKGVAVDLGVTEDIRTKTAPDVSLLIGLRASF
jgi:hypothetical protein